MSIFKPEKYTGVADLGTPDQKANLYDVRELVSAPAGVSLAPTDPSKWKIWPKRNQDGQMSCVYHARAKMAGILKEQETGEFIEYSACDYEKRSNKPEEGSYPIESMDFMRKYGIGLEVLEPSNDLSAQQLRDHKQSEFDKKAAELSLLDGYYAIPAYNFDLFLSTLHATKKPIPLGFFATHAEWNRNVPNIQDPTLTLVNGIVRHEVCATPNYGIYNGEEGFTIEDSWGSTGINGAGVRWITRSFFQKRNYIPGLVPTKFKGYEDIGVDPAKPKAKFTRDLSRGDTGPDVFLLQQVYKYEGFFPANHSGSQFFGPITENCTKQYQAKYGIVSEGTPETTGYGRVGPKTRAHINNRYK